MPGEYFSLFSSPTSLDSTFFILSLSYIIIKKE